MPDGAAVLPKGCAGLDANPEGVPVVLPPNGCAPVAFPNAGAGAVPKDAEVVVPPKGLEPPGGAG